MICDGEAEAQIRFRESRKRDKARMERIAASARRERENQIARAAKPATIRLPGGVTFDLQAWRKAVLRSRPAPWRLLADLVRAYRIRYGRRRAR